MSYILSDFVEMSGKFLNKTEVNKIKDMILNGEANKIKKYINDVVSTSNTSISVFARSSSQANYMFVDSYSMLAAYITLNTLYTIMNNGGRRTN